MACLIFTDVTLRLSLKWRADAIPPCAPIHVSCGISLSLFPTWNHDKRVNLTWPLPLPPFAKLISHSISWVSGIKDPVGSILKMIRSNINDRFDIGMLVLFSSTRGLWLKSNECCFTSTCVSLSISLRNCLIDQASKLLDSLLQEVCIASWAGCCSQV